MTIKLAYEPEKVDWDGTREIDFYFESIGAVAFEVWLETETDPDVFDRVLVTPQYYNVTFGPPRPLYNGGTVVLTGTIPDTVTRISLERNTPITQVTDLKEFTPFHMHMLEFVLDKLTMIIQEMAYRKCSVEATLPIEQTIRFETQHPLYASIIDYTLDKVTAYCLQMASTGEDCTDDPDGT